ncbi:MAG: DUF4330 domain-containing protein [Oscillospiraceae bacterium]|nr:DUF4330 domain-containing protein [Oscillospiraceae bacterium]
MENKAKREKRRLLTAFDIVIIAAVVVLAALFLVWQASKNAAAAPGSEAVSGTVTYTLELNNFENADNLSVGDRLYETVKNTDVGVVKSFEIVPQKIWQNDLETGGMKVTETEMRTAHLTIEAPCTVTASTIATKAGAVEIRVGRSLGVTGPGYWGAGFIIAIERS